MNESIHRYDRHEPGGVDALGNYVDTGGMVESTTGSWVRYTYHLDIVNEMKLEIERLRAAIGTPEIYAGIITEVVAAELDALRAEIGVLKMGFTPQQQQSPNQPGPMQGGIGRSRDDHQGNGTTNG